jgi:hypothetical protein
MKKTHLFLAMLLAGAAAVSPLKARNVEIVKADSLVVNTDDSKRYISSLSLEKGLLSLQDIVFNNEFEEAWVYDLSGAGFDSNAVWIETGYEATGIKHGDPIFGDLPFYKEFETNGVNNDNEYIAQENVESSIHIHPIKNTAAYKAARFNDDYSAMSKEMKVLKAVYALPSWRDLGSIILELKGHPHQREFKFYIGSYSGITEYNLTEKGRERLTKMMGSSKADKELTKIFTNIRSSVKRRLESMDDSTAILNEAFNENSDKYFQIRFISYNELREKGL